MQTCDGWFQCTSRTTRKTLGVVASATLLLLSDGALSFAATPSPPQKDSGFISESLLESLAPADGSPPSKSFQKELAFWSHHPLAAPSIAGEDREEVKLVPEEELNSEPEEVIGGDDVQETPSKPVSGYDSFDLSNKIVGDVDVTDVCFEVSGKTVCIPPREKGTHFESESSSSAGQPLVDPFADVVVLGTESDWHCTGVLVSPTWVLTAAHCLPLARVGVGLNVNTLKETRVIKRTAAAPDSIDVVLVELSAAVDAELKPRRKARDDAPPYSKVTLVGFGSDSPTGSTGFGVKRMVSVPASGWGCDIDRERALGCLSGREFVLSSLRGNDTCNGDSGGPVYERHGGGLRLTGITSRPILRSRTACGIGGIYIRIDRLDAWISSTIQPKESP